MQYFKNNEFDAEYIDMYKQQITDLWKNEYMPIQTNFNPPEESNKLASHIQYLKNIDLVSLMNLIII